MSWFDILKDKVSDMFSGAFKKPTDKLNLTEDKKETAQITSDASKRKVEREIKERKRKENEERRKKISSGGGFGEYKPTDEQWKKTLQNKNLFRFNK